MSFPLCVKVWYIFNGHLNLTLPQRDGQGKVYNVSIYIKYKDFFWFGEIPIKSLDIRHFVT